MHGRKRRESGEKRQVGVHEHAGRRNTGETMLWAKELQAHAWQTLH